MAITSDIMEISYILNNSGMYKFPTFLKSDTLSLSLTYSNQLDINDVLNSEITNSNMTYSSAKNNVNNSASENVVMSRTLISELKPVLNSDNFEAMYLNSVELKNSKIFNSNDTILEMLYSNMRTEVLPSENTINDYIYNEELQMSRIYQSHTELTVMEYISGRHATKKNDSDILLYSVTDSKLDASKNLIKDLRNNINYYDSSAMWGRIILNSSSTSETIEMSKLQPNQYYVLIYDRQENTENETLTPNMYISYTGTNLATDLKQMSMYFDTHLVRFKTPPEVSEATITVELGNVPEGAYTFSNFAIFKASDYEEMLIDTKDIMCVIPENEDYVSENEKERKEAILKLVDEIKESVHEYIGVYDPYNSTKYIEVKLKSYKTNSLKGKDSFMEISYQVHTNSKKDALISTFEENIVMLDDYYTYTKPLGKFSITYPNGLDSASMLKLLMDNDYVGNVQVLNGEERREVILVLIEDYVVKSVSKPAIIPRHKMHNTNDGSTPTPISNNLVVMTNGTISYNFAQTQTINSGEIWVGSVSSRSLAPENDLHHTKDTRPLWNTKENTYEMNNYDFWKLSPKTHQHNTRRGTITDTYSPYKEFYYESLDHTYIEDVYHNEEFFRLFGKDRETDVFNAYSLRRNSRDSIILLDGVPIEFTNYRLIEYDNVEYVVVNEIDDIKEFGELHTFGHGTSSSESTLYIHKDGTVDTSQTNGMFVSNFSNVLKLGKGIHYIRDGYVCIGENYLVLDSNDKVFSYPKKIAFLNKIIVIEDDVTVYVPIREAYSMYEDVIREVYAVKEFKNDFVFWKEFLMNTMKSCTTVNDFLSDVAWNYPGLTSFKGLKTPSVISSEIEIHLDNVSSECRRYVYNEFDLEMIQSTNTPYDINVYSPKVLIPVRQNSKNVLIFLNDRLFKVNPTKFNDDFYAADIRDIYNKKDYEFLHRLDKANSWYSKNKKNNTFEVVYYDEDDIIIDTTFTKHNDSFIPLPLDTIGMNYEVYVDGVFVGNYSDSSNGYIVDYTHLKIGLLLTSLEKGSSSFPGIPALFIRKTSRTDKYSLGSNVVVICTRRKNENTMIKCSNKEGFFIVEQGLSTHTELFYPSGLKIKSDEFIKITPHLVYVKSKPQKILVKGEYTVDRQHDYSVKVCEALCSIPEFIQHLNTNESLDLDFPDALNTLTMNEFNDYRTIVCGALFFSKNGITPDTMSNTSFGKIESHLGKPLKPADFISGDKVEFSKVGIMPLSITYYDVLRKISPYVYTERTSSEINVDDKFFFQKISYMISIIYSEVFTQYDGNKFDRGVYENALNPTSTIGTFIIPDDIVESFNSVFGMDMLYPDSYDFSRINTLTNTIMDVYGITTRIGSSYGILRPEWYTDTDNSKKANIIDTLVESLRNTEFRIAVQNKDLFIHDFIKGAICPA